MFRLRLNRSPLIVEVVEIEHPVERLATPQVLYCLSFRCHNLLIILGLCLPVETAFDGKGGYCNNEDDDDEEE